MKKPSIEKLEEDVEGYLEKLKKLLEDNEETIAEAIERSSQVITSVTSVSEAFIAILDD